MTRLTFASTANKDLLYKVRVRISDPFFFLETNTANYIFLDSREIGVFKEQNKNKKIKVVDITILIKEVRKKHPKGDIVGPIALSILEKYGKHTKRIEVSNSFPLDLADYLREKRIKVKVKKPFCPEREVKTASEVKAIQKSIENLYPAYRLIEKILTDSKVKGKYLMYKGETLTSEFLKREVTKILVEKDMFNEVGIIISSGKQAAIPHHEGSGPILAHETIVCDLFPVSIKTGYFSDMTRTYIKGTPSKEAGHMYDAVLKAQEAAIKTVKAGIKSKEVQMAAENVFTELGFDVGSEGFTHAVGHGIGLDIHEGPNVSRNPEPVLIEGHVVTIEPGLYYRKHGGVRIEDVVVVTKNGCRNLTKYPKQFIIK